MARIESPLEATTPLKFARLLKSYRSKIRRYIEPGTSFSIELVIGCTVQDLFSYVEKHRTPEMSWDKYGSTWCFSNMESPRNYDLSNSEQFLSYFNFRSFKPILTGDLVSTQSRAQGLPVLKGQSQPIDLKPQPAKKKARR